MSVNVGGTISFKIDSTMSAYHIDILRLGYYQGDGARKIASNLAPTAVYPQAQPACLTDATTGLIDCGNWSVSASWAVPTTAVSGYYVAHLHRDDTGAGSLIPFVVRNDGSHSAILYETNDETQEAYNTYGGNSLYQCTVACPPGNPQGYKGAYAVSYNRPWHTADDDSGRSWFLYAELPMIEFMEQNGYDVSYVSASDIDANGGQILNHKIFMDAGHDEYWSANQRTAVQAAINSGVNAAFFSGNEVFWKTRFAPSEDGTSTPSRTLVTYKETHFTSPTDPQDPPTWTGSWADPRFSPPADGGNPANALTGQEFLVNSGSADIQVPYAYSKLRLWRNTAVANLQPGQTLTLDPGGDTLGYEWDTDVDNGFRPAGEFDVSSTTVNAPEVFNDYGTNTVAATVTHKMSEYRASSGALVFGAGTVQWSWGLEDGTQSGKPHDVNMQQATVNLFADMGVQPYSLISGLVAASPSGDVIPPSSTVTSPAAAANLADGTSVTVTGTASDVGGIVAGVEVSTDGGATWHPANGTTNWSYLWVAHGNPTTRIMSRAVDDSGNIEVPSAGEIVNVGCPCSIFGTGAVPGTIDSGDSSAIEVGVKFTSDVFGTVKGIRFYKATANTGTHIGNLWTASGQLLASVTFIGETASGWQEADFSAPVAIQPHTTYVASYYAPKGHYSIDQEYFLGPPQPATSAPSILNSPPLHALHGPESAGNGMYQNAGDSTFPATTDTSGGNYWVDLSFVPQPAPGQATNVVATGGYGSAGLTWSAPSSGGPVTTYTVTPYVGSQAQSTIVVAGNPAPTSTTITNLTNGTTYTFTVTASNPSGSAGPSAPSNAVTPSTSASVIGNGGFETGNLAPWAAGGLAVPTVSNAKPHSGTYSALLGQIQPAPEVAGDSFISQAVTVPIGTSQLSFWYWTESTDSLCSGASCVNDWEEAQIRDTQGNTLAQVFKSNTDAQAWTQVTFPTTAFAGQSIVLWFNVHGDGSSPPDDSWMYLDDVTLTATGAPSIPGAPTGLSAVAGGASATVSWTAPANNGSPITSYVVTPFVGSTAGTPLTVSGSPAPTTATVTGLTPGTTYIFKVAAINSVGTGATSSPSNSVTPNAATLPGAPTGVSATVGDTTSTVSWTAPSNGGSPITSYTVTPYLADETNQAGTPVVVSGAPPPTSVTVSGLTDGTSYTFQVTATNSIGTGPASAPSNVVTPESPPVAPAAPTNVAAAPGNQSATVSWTAPADGGSAITSYVITPYVASTAQAARVLTGSPPPTTAVVSGLTNGATYTFTVIAENGAGAGPPSANSNAVTPEPPTTPGAPTAVTAVAGTGSATISWTAPVSDGGAEITSYTVTPYIGSSAQAATVVTGTPPSTTATVPSLTDGTSYTFTVAATNAAGTGPASGPSNSVIPLGVPGTPTGVTAVAGVGSVTVSWTAPPNGGSAITSYIVTPYVGTSAQTPVTVSGNPPATSTVVSGLSNGTTYTFSVTATNSQGAGGASTPSNPATPEVSAPTCPCTIFGSAIPGTPDGGDGSSVNLGVQFSSDTNGFITGIRFYKATANTGTHVGSLWTASGTLLASATFSNETASGWQLVRFASPVAVTAGTTYVASYLAPNGHYAITGNGLASEVESPPLHAYRNSTATPNGLYQYGSTNAFPVSTFGAANYWVDAIFATSAVSAPGAPTGVTATASGGSATVAWTAPDNGGSAITSYTVTPYLGTSAQTPTILSGNPPATSTVVVGLTNGDSYTFTVSATNSIGTGPASVSSNAVTPEPSSPSAPVNVTAVAGIGSVTVSWSAPANGGSPITSYTVTPYVGATAKAGTTVSGAPPSTTVTLTGLTVGTTYTFTVSATSSAGTGPASAASNPATTEAAAPGCPCTLLGSATPQLVDAGDGSSVQVGVEFTSDTNGYIDGIRFYKATANTGTHVGSLWTSTGTLLASATFTNETASGWQQVLFSSPVPVTAGTTYVVSYFAPSGHYSATGNGFAAQLSSPPLYAFASSGVTPNGLYAYTSSPSTFPTSTFGAADYWVDVVFTQSVAGSPAAPTAVSAVAGNASAIVSWTAPSADGGSPITSYVITPYLGTTAQTPTVISGSPPATTATVTGLTNGTTYTFTVIAANAVGSSGASAPSNAVTPLATVTPPSAPTEVSASAGNGSAAVTWTAASNGGSPVTSYTVTPYVGSVAQTAAVLSGSPPATSTTFTGLSNGTTYTFTVSATNSVGTGPASAPSNPATPAAAAPSCPCTIFGPATPSTVDSGDVSSVQLGVQFTSDTSGFINGLRFYKAAANTGTHIGSLWSSTGTLLASATFAGETASGWQQVLFSNPIAVTAGTTYVAAYLAPKGHYSVNGAGLAAEIVNPPLYALASSGSTPNGVFAYTSSASTFPTGTFGAANYWVDVVFSPSALIPPPAPTGVSAVAGNGAATVNWTAPASGGSPITKYTVTPYVGSTAQTPTVVSGNPPATSVTVTGLTDGTTYTFTVAATNSVGTGLASSASNPVTPQASASCPCTILGSATPATVDAGDGSSVQLGVAFSSDTNGYVSGVRFYKAAANTGTHVGSLWSASGSLLASATFTNETASGWQQVAFSTPVAVTAGTTYVASYLAPNGHYSVTGNAFAAQVNNPPLYALADSGTTPNGVFAYTSTATTFPTGTFGAANYWVDVVFNQTATVAPLAPIGVSAVAGTGTATVSWTAPASGGSPITSYTVTPYIGSAPQAPTVVSGSPPATTVVVSGLTNGTTYTFTVSATNGVGTGPASSASNAVTPQAASASCPCTLLGAGSPAVIDSGDGSSVQVGVEFSSDTNGFIDGVRFYKATTNIGSHVGSVWRSDGTLLASATFTNETASGWQQVLFSSPVAVTAGTTYVASYLAPSGHYAATSNAFASQVANPPLYAPASSANTPNGVYAYTSSATTFPTSTFGAANYWVDVLFSQTPMAAPSAPTGVSAGAGDTTASVSWTAPPDGGSPITSYTITPYVGAAAQTPVVVTNTPPATTATVTGLTDGTTYTFTVSATNALGTSPASAASGPATPAPATAPSAPTGVSATAGTGSATVSWTAPADGGSPITSYTVTPYLGATAQTPVVVSGTPPSTGTAVTGLTSGSAYTFTVSATNGVGTGPPSAPSNSVTPQ